MLTLISPAALWALAALALPLALHLWRRPPRTVRLGSLRFLQTHTGRRLHDLRWRERLLLCVRLGLLTAVAMLLMRPVWRSFPSQVAQHWIVVDPAAAPGGKSLDRLHALQATGYTTRQLPGPAPVDLWSLLHEADALLPANSKLAVFSPVRLASLQGIRPALKASLEWVETPDIKASATATRGDPKTGKSNSVPLSVSIFQDAERAEDARYLAAAIRTAVEAAPSSLDLWITVVTSDPVVPVHAADWTFWLSAKEPPASIQNGRTRLFQDAPQTADTVAGWIVPQPGTDFPAASVRLWQRGPAVAGAVVWTDDHGVPLLTRAPGEYGVRWHFASRFHPAWTDLPRTTAFPAWLRSFLLPAAPDDPANDLRHAAATQVKASENLPPASKSPPLAGSEIHDLHWLIWTITACLFIAERLLSHHRRPTSPITVSSPPLAVAR